MIILTREQANRVRGLTIPGHALAPVPLADGTFALPESVLTDPAHARFHAGLAALPRVLDRSLRQGRPANPDDPELADHRFGLGAGPDQTRAARLPIDLANRRAGRGR